jgi:hypothetical protein
VTAASHRLFGGGAADALRAAGDCLEAAARERTGPYSGASPADLAAVAAGIEPFPEEGAGLDAALGGPGRLSVRHGVDPGHPACAAHPHCQPLAAAVAAGALATATTSRSTPGTRPRWPPTWSGGWWPGWPPGSASTPRWPAGW